jgi:hypothetical protein
MTHTYDSYYYFLLFNQVLLSNLFHNKQKLTKNIKFHSNETLTQKSLQKYLKFSPQCGESNRKQKGNRRQKNN